MLIVSSLSPPPNSMGDYGVSYPLTSLSTNDSYSPKDDIGVVSLGGVNHLSSTWSSS